MGHLPIAHSILALFTFGHIHQWQTIPRDFSAHAILMAQAVTAFCFSWKRVCFDIGSGVLTAAASFFGTFVCVCVPFRRQGRPE